MIVSATALGQSPSHTLAVHGVVFDSVVHAPLAGATVQIARRDGAGPLYTTESDSAGHFRVAGLPSGEFVIGFYADAVTALGLDAPQRAFSGGADTDATVDLGIPAGPTVRDLRCGLDAHYPRSGMLAGLVRRAVDLAPMAGATVAAEWREIVGDSGSFHIAPQHAVAMVGSDGSFQLCGLPGDEPLTIRFSAPGLRAIAGSIIVPSAGVLRRDVRLANATAERGSATIRGRVVHASGTAVTSARVEIRELVRDAPVTDGAFALTNVPVGTWAAEVRAIGLEPQSVWLEAYENGAAETTITVGDIATPIQPVTVIGKASRDQQVLEAVRRRQLSSFGTAFVRGSTWLEGAAHTADVLRAARGFKYVSPDEVYGRSIPPSVRSKQGTQCTAINVYVDGDYFPGGLKELDTVAPVEDVLAVEAFPDVAFAPIQWRSNLGMRTNPDGTEREVCAVVAVWRISRGALHP